MAESARVESIESLKLFKRALWKYQENASIALGEAESDIQRVMMWLEGEQRTFWAGEVRKRQDAVMRAKDALRQKQIFKSPTGGRQSDVDEQKALQLAMRRLAEAEQKVIAVQKYTQLLRREMMMYKGQVQRITTVVSGDIPQAAHDLEAIIQRLEAYASGEGVATPEMAASEASDQSSMKRATTDSPDQPSKPGEQDQAEQEEQQDPGESADDQTRASQPGSDPGGVNRPEN